MISDDKYPEMRHIYRTNLPNMKKKSIPYNMLSPAGRNNGIFGIDTMVIGDRIPNKQMRNIADSET